MSYLVKDIAIAFIFVVTGWMLKNYLNHREKMTGLAMTNPGLVSSDQRLARVERAVESIAIKG
ncbi:MAG: hypothetical protein NVSMB53_04150 [Gemmatimonadaceae bacterium]